MRGRVEIREDTKKQGRIRDVYGVGKMVVCYGNQGLEWNESENKIVVI